MAADRFDVDVAAERVRASLLEGFQWAFRFPGSEAAFLLAWRDRGLSALDSLVSAYKEAERERDEIRAVRDEAGSAWTCQVCWEARERMNAAEDRATVAEARLAQAEEALRTARQDIVAVAREGWDSTRGKRGLAAIARIDAALAVSETAGKEQCSHPSLSFDRSFCACGAMHDYCDECGKALDCPLNETAGKEPEETYPEGWEAS